MNNKEDIDYTINNNNNTSQTFFLYFMHNL